MTARSGTASWGRRRACASDGQTQDLSKALTSVWNMGRIHARHLNQGTVSSIAREPKTGEPADQERRHALPPNRRIPSRDIQALLKASSLRSARSGC